MKLNEITNSPEDTFAYKWLRAHRIDDFVINHDGTVIIRQTNLNLRGIEDKTLPFKVGMVGFGSGGNIDAADSKLESLEWCPRTCNRLNLSGCTKLKSLEGVPRVIEDSLSIRGTDITSFIGITDQIDEMKTLTASWGKITEGGLGLVLIKGLRFLTAVASSGAAPFRIIEKYLGKPDQVFECQQELIDAGYQEHAKL